MLRVFVAPLAVVLAVSFFVQPGQAFFGGSGQEPGMECGRKSNSLLCGAQETAPCSTEFGALCIRCDAQPVTGQSTICKPKREATCFFGPPFNSESCGNRYQGACVDPGPGGTWTCQEVYNGECDKAASTCNL